ncbi:acyltransferase domain-containing protein [Streptomyces sp. NPDC056254]|uniref:acyltransferase domain-containing protein n=1 Tax=Streptomyces sp. NPDC056254 TaxID=3345763 RepID=UPI0035D76190
MTRRFISENVFLFPGQGCDPAGALLYLVNRTNSARTPALHEANLIIDQIGKTAAASGYGPEGAIREMLLREAPANRFPYGISQLAQFAASVALTRYLACLNVRPSQVVGHSLGEYAALVCADVFTADDGTRLICALNDAYSALVGKGGLVLLQASESVVRDLLDSVPGGDLAVACVNSTEQVVVSGPTSAIAALMALEGPAVPRRRVLPVPYPGHHPALGEAREGFLRSVKDVHQRRISVPVWSAVQHRVYTDADDLRVALADGFTKPVYFSDAIKRLQTPGSRRRFIEVGVGASLKTCVRSLLRDAAVISPLSSAR